jgi:iron(III) transport system substrate-binding protein
VLISRFPFVRTVALVLACLVSACGSPQGAAPRSAPAASQQAAGARAPASSDWDQTVAAAKKEGKVVIAGPNYALWTQGLKTFQQAYPDIRIEITEFNSRDFWVKLATERKAGQYLWDMRIGGPDPQVFDALKAGELAPVKPLLVQPDVTDPSKWFGGADGMYADKNKQYLFSFVAEAGYAAYVNRDVVPESVLKTEDQLLDPAWTGKIAIQDPSGGAGLGSLTTMYGVHGEQYVHDLLARQKITVTRDQRQEAEWAVRGTYPIGIGIAPTDLELFKQQGLKFNVPGLDFPHKLSSGSGGIQLIDRAPHPNATKVYLNWLLSQQAQAVISKTAGVNSRRLDVPPGNPDPTAMLDPKQLNLYVPHQNEELLPQRERSAALAKELLGNGS